MNETELWSLPDEERFRLIADKVMGGERDYIYSGDFDIGVPKRYFEHIPDYDTPDGMMRIVERMREQGWKWVLYVAEHCRAEVYKPGVTYRAVCGDLPRAVELAALRAVGEIE